MSVFKKKKTRMQFSLDIWTQDQSLLCIIRSFLIDICSVESHLAPCQTPLPVINTLKPVESISVLSWMALASPVTNEVVMELQLLAEIANDIFGTGQVFSAGGNLTPPNGTTGREERVWSAQTCWCFTGACVCLCVCDCITILVRTCLKAGHYN